MDAGCHGFPAQAEQPFDPEGEAECRQGTLPLRVDEVAAQAERCSGEIRAVEVDPDLGGSGAAAASAGGFPDGEIEADVRRPRRDGQAGNVERGDALAGQDDAVDADDLRLRLGPADPGEDAVEADESRRGDGQQALHIRVRRGSAHVQFVQDGTDPDGVDPAEILGELQHREDDEPRVPVTGQQDRRGTGPLAARDDLGRDVRQTVGDAEVRQPPVLREAESVQAVIPDRRDDRRVGEIGGEAEVAPPQIDGHGRRTAELVGHAPGAIEIAARDGQRQRGVPPAQDGGGSRTRLPGTAQDQYRFPVLHDDVLSLFD